ncbi:MAG: ATP-dependent Clp protease ATP-binding subunit [Lachnospiraceae bacterium]|nr:ATP-dependent Clp protease ATP-binding subunit [Lachnospiraceae bacterium]
MKTAHEAYSERVLRMFQLSLQFAAHMGCGFVGSEHLLWAMTQDQGKSGRILRRCGVNGKLISEYLQKYGEKGDSDSGAQAIQIAGEAEQVLRRASEIAEHQAQEVIELEDLLAAMLKGEDNAGAQILQSLDIDKEQLAKELQQINDMAGKTDIPLAEVKDRKGQGEENLSKYGRDITKKAREGGFDPVIGREDVVDRLVQVLSRRTKNNPVLIGDPGVGKTAVVEELAQHIASELIPQNLQNKRIISMDLVGMVSGARFRGDFEERIKVFLEEAEGAEDIILFLDELHTLIGTGSSSGDTMDAANILKPVLARGKLQVIGATTRAEYRKYVEKDVALERRFQPILLEEPSQEDAVNILRGLKGCYESFHGLEITDEAVKASVELSVRYIPDRYLPDKAIDLMDEAASRLRTRSMMVPTHLQALKAEIKDVCDRKKKAAILQEYEQAAVLRDKQIELEKTLKNRQEIWRKKQEIQVNSEAIAQVVSAWTKIPVTMLTKEESQRLRSLEEMLHRRVIGQEEAVTAVARAIRRGRTGVADPNRPIGSFLFLGPTGVGKTELCRALAEVVFQDENAIIRMDMSEYIEKHTVARMIGSPPGYVGYEEGGQLTEQVRKRPYSIVLFDEIEKAHPDVCNALLQILDDGRLTNGQGRTVSFKNTIIVLTSNVGARDILGEKFLGFSGTVQGSETRLKEEIRSAVMKEVKMTFSPEFLNRLNEIIVFRQLRREDIWAIAREMTNRLSARMAKKGIRLVVEDSAVDVLSAKGFDPIYGARTLQRSIQSVLQNAVADQILEGSFEQKDEIVASGKEEDICLAIRRRS